MYYISAPWNFIIKLRDEKKDVKKLKYYILIKEKKFIKCLIAINCQSMINRSKKGIRLFKFSANNIHWQLAVLL